MKRSLVVFLLIVFACSAWGSTRIYFSPKGGCTDAIISEIAMAKKTIDIAMYSFSSRPIVTELIKAKDRGVRIRVYMDKGQEAAKYSGSRFMMKNGFDVKFDRGSGLMHNKFALIDGATLITGSFNWTRQAEYYNRENLLVITDPAVVGRYRDRFESLWRMY